MQKWNRNIVLCFVTISGAAFWAVGRSFTSLTSCEALNSYRTIQNHFFLIFFSLTCLATNSYRTIQNHFFLIFFSLTCLGTASSTSSISLSASSPSFTGFLVPFFSLSFLFFFFCFLQSCDFEASSILSIFPLAVMTNKYSLAPCIG